MATYRITAPDGNAYNVTAPENASQDEVLAYAKANYKSSPTNRPGLMKRGWDALAKPEQMSKQGLSQLAGMVPNPEPKGNLMGDLRRGTPRIAADTLAEAAPGFVSRGALLTAGAMPALRGLGKVAEVVGPGVAGQLESLSGMKPGLLTKAFKDPSLIFSSIPKGAREAYQASSELAKSSPEVSQTARPLALATKLLAKLKTGMITPDEALSGRKAVDQLWESKAITEDWKNMARKSFDAIAKTEPDIKEADIGFSRGKQAAGLRQLLPQNKYGRTSAFKTAIMAALNAMGAPGKIAMAGMSPLAMGTGATALGAGAKLAGPITQSPKLAVSIQQLLQKLRAEQGQP